MICWKKYGLGPSDVIMGVTRGLSRVSSNTRLARQDAAIGESDRPTPISFLECYFLYRFALAHLGAGDNVGEFV
jgi:hypothetical protein